MSNLFVNIKSRAKLHIQTSCVFDIFAALPDDSYPVMVVSVRMDGSDGGDSERTKSQQH